VLTTNAREPAAAAELVRFLASRDAAKAIVQSGLAPLVQP